MKKVVVTGANGLLGWHASVRLYAANCAAAFHGEDLPFEIVRLGHAVFDNDAQLHTAVAGADAILHFAGLNRAPDPEVEAANPAIARRLVAACKSAGVHPHIAYANSTHATADNPYGRSKRIAGEILAEYANSYADLILPHIFGECARPFYNNVTATLIDQVLAGDNPTVNPDGAVNLVHAGTAAQAAIDSISGEKADLVALGQQISIPELLSRIQSFHASYQANIFPDLNDAFDVMLFNSYRAATYPDGWPRALKLHSDTRGTLFEAVKGGGGGQCFLSTTEPGVTRGDHFHLGKVERFLVIQGQATIRIRKVLGNDTWAYTVNGDNPAPVDMPTLHTHSIENTGDTPLLTLFWTHDLFDLNNPDTFADKVLQ